MAEQKFFKELELGFRELFRILIPGAYVVSLAQVIAPNAAFSQIVIKSTASGLAATFFLGLIGYALRVHERWFPYFWYFEEQRAKLNAEIARIASISGQSDNVDFYKYFLETSAEDLGDRIHYFTSFYYMLMELSLFSAAAAYGIVAHFLFAAGVSQPVAKLAAFLICLACVIQLVVLFSSGGVRTKRTKVAILIELLLAMCAVIVLILCGFLKGVISVPVLVSGIGFTPAILCIISYLFWRLGDKHWKQIIGEQFTLVNNRAAKLIEASKRYAGPYVSGADAAHAAATTQPNDTNGS